MNRPFNNTIYQRTIVVGDIHGCMDELMKLLDTIKFSDSDLLISVGDILDRGPKSWEVARYFRQTSNAIVVKGNHERRVAGTIRGTSMPAMTQQHTLSLLPKEEWLDWAEWLEQLPAMIEVEHTYVAHARIDPDKEMYNQDEYHLCGVGSREHEMRCDAQGVPYWFRKLPSLKKPLCIGHITYERINVLDGKLYALDTDCCMGGQLTAAVFPEQQIVSVQAKKNWFAESKKQWREEIMAQQRYKKLTVAELIHAVQSAKTDETWFTELNQTLQRIRLYSVIHEGRGWLVGKFGEVPRTGAEKKIYYQKLRTEMGDALTHRMATGLLNRRYSTTEELLDSYKKSSWMQFEMACTSIIQLSNL